MVRRRDPNPRRIIKKLERFVDQTLDAGISERLRTKKLPKAEDLSGISKVLNSYCKLLFLHRGRPSGAAEKDLDSMTEEERAQHQYLYGNPDYVEALKKQMVSPGSDDEGDEADEDTGFDEI